MRSYAINDTEKRYSATELEALGVLIACKKCNYFLQGLDSFEVVTDHKALVKIFQKDIETIPNPRLRAFRENIMDMSFSVTYLKGKDNEAVDALSRVPTWCESGVQDPAENVFHVRRTLYRRWYSKHVVKGKIRSVSASLNYAREGIQLDKMFKVGEKDKMYNMVVDKLREGTSRVRGRRWPD